MQTLRPSELVAMVGLADGDGRLPRGRHRIPAEVIARSQRERMIAAVTQVSAEIGYPETSVARIIALAGVSRATFYTQFSNRRDCMLVAFSTWSALLEAEIAAAAAAASDIPAAIRAALRRALDLLASEPAMAKLLTTEILTVVPEGPRVQQATITRLADRLRVARRGILIYATGGPDWEWCAVAGMIALIGKRLAAGEVAHLPELEPQLTWIALSGGSV